LLLAFVMPITWYSVFRAVGGDVI